jgi:hypothetical protein
MNVQDHTVRQPHRHTVVTLHALTRRAGIPYEVERATCAVCRRVLDERVVRRAAA